MAGFLCGLPSKPDDKEHESFGFPPYLFFPAFAPVTTNIIPAMATMPPA
jgi:hypothetical protein